MQCRYVCRSAYLACRSSCIRAFKCQLSSALCHSDTLSIKKYHRHTNIFTGDLHPRRLCNQQGSVNFVYFLPTSQHSVSPTKERVGWLCRYNGQRSMTKSDVGTAPCKFMLMTSNKKFPYPAEIKMHLSVWGARAR